MAAAHRRHVVDGRGVERLAQTTNVAADEGGTLVGRETRTIDLSRWIRGVSPHPFGV
jgi:hypothetical protein